MSYVVLVQGETGTTKSTVGLSFPKKLQYFELDIGGFDRAKRRFKKEIKDGLILMKTYELPQQVIEDHLGLAPASKLLGVKELWYQILNDYKKAMNDPEIESIMFDSGTFLWNVCWLATLQEAQERNNSRVQLTEIEYGEANIRFRTLIYQARRSHKHLIFTAPMTELRQDTKVRGETKSVVVGTRAAGWKHLPTELDFIIETSIRQEKDKEGNVSYVPTGKILKSAVGLELLGMEFDYPSYDVLEGLVKMMEGDEEE